MKIDVITIKYHQFETFFNGHTVAHYFFQSLIYQCNTTNH